jgi:ribonuclease BN (tRNA processing enzyme)
MAEPLSLTVLGCDGSYPGPGGACSGYLVRCDATSVWVDAGAGTLANLQRHIPIGSIDAVVVSHRHVDHWTDLEHLAVAYKFIVGRSGVPVYSCEGLEAAMRVGDATDVFDWHPVRGGSAIEVGAVNVSFSRTDHLETTLAVRVDGGGRSLGYSADTGAGWELSQLGPGLHLALCEATFMSDREGTLPHLSARQAGESARRAGVERLVITHLWPGMDRAASQAEASAAFGRDVTVAATGDRYVA